jgi:hypothetical protein
MRAVLETPRLSRKDAPVYQKMRMKYLDDKFYEILEQIAPSPDS